MKYSNNSKEFIYDFAGIKHDSVESMCKYYQIPIKTYFARRNELGWDEEKALTTPPIRRKREGERKDHLGNTYKTLNELCVAYNISVSLYCVRHRTLGWSLEKTLTTPVETRYSHKPGTATDHLGNTYRSVASMCKHYGVSYDNYRNRIRNGWTVEEALCRNVNALDSDYFDNYDFYMDHNGNIYFTLDEMCECYNIKVTTFTSRRRMGWPLDKALETPTREKASYNYEDDYLDDFER